MVLSIDVEKVVGIYVLVAAAGAQKINVTLFELLDNSARVLLGLFRGVGVVYIGPESTTDESACLKGV